MDLEEAHSGAEAACFGDPLQPMQIAPDDLHREVVVAEAPSVLRPPSPAVGQQAPAVSEAGSVAAAQAGRASRHSGSAQVTVFLAHGKLSYYPHDQRFEAVCRRHQAAPDVATGSSGVLCRLTRTGRANARRPAQGRPCGLMMAWLHVAAEVADRTCHCDAFFVGSISREARRAARAMLSELPNGALLLQCERALRAGEDSEPDACP